VARSGPTHQYARPGRARRGPSVTMGWMFRISGFLVSLVLTCAALAGTAAMRAEVAVAAEPALRAQ